MAINAFPSVALQKFNISYVFVDKHQPHISSNPMQFGDDLNEPGPDRPDLPTPPFLSQSSFDVPGGGSFVSRPLRLSLDMSCFSRSTSPAFSMSATGAIGPGLSDTGGGDMYPRLSPASLDSFGTSFHQQRLSSICTFHGNLGKFPQYLKLPPDCSFCWISVRINIQGQLFFLRV